MSLRISVPQPGHQFLGAPGRVRLPGRNQALHHLRPSLVGMPVRCPAQVSQPIPAPGLETLDPFIAGLPADSKGSAQIQEGLSPALPAFYEPDLFRFRTRILPGHHFPPHRHLPILLGKCYPCSRFFCYQSTRFVPTSILSHKGRGTHFHLSVALRRSMITLNDNRDNWSPLGRPLRLPV